MLLATEVITLVTVANAEKPVSVLNRTAPRRVDPKSEQIIYIINNLNNRCILCYN